MNPRQRRGAVFLSLTVVGALVVFFAVLSYVGDVTSKVGPLTSAVRFKGDVPAYTPITPEMLETVEVPERWVSQTTVRSVADVVGLVAATDYAAGSVVQQGMLVPRPGIQPGYREVAIIVDAETGVAGKVRSGDRVDIIATAQGDKESGVPQSAQVWVSNALVLEVGLPRATEGADAQGNFESTSGVPVTFALSAEEALRLAYVESFSVKLRLALRGAGDSEVLPPSGLVYKGEAQP